MNPNFVFTDEPTEKTSGAAYVHVPETISSKADLLALFSRGLSFPATFGGNWDALYDCLCDLSWIQGKQVVITHEGVPSLSRTDLQAYLGVLGDAVASWRDNPGRHEIVVVFPSNATAAMA